MSKKRIPNDLQQGHYSEGWSKAAANCYAFPRCICGHKAQQHLYRAWHGLRGCLKCKNRKRRSEDCYLYTADMSARKTNPHHKSKARARKRVRQRMARIG